VAVVGVLLGRDSDRQNKMRLWVVGELVVRMAADFILGFFFDGCWWEMIATRRRGGVGQFNIMLVMRGCGVNGFVVGGFRQWGCCGLRVLRIIDLHNSHYVTLLWGVFWLHAFCVRWGGDYCLLSRCLVRLEEAIGFAGRGKSVQAKNTWGGAGLGTGWLEWEKKSAKLVFAYRGQIIRQLFGIFGRYSAIIRH
jgi:hypothetical protein